GRADEDEGRAPGLIEDHGLRQSLRARAWDERGGVIADAPIEQRPLDAVGKGGDQPRQFRRYALRHVVHDGVPGKVDVLGKAAPEMGRLFGRGVAITDAVRIVAPVGVLAMTVLAEMAPFALAAHDVVLD